MKEKIKTTTFWLGVSSAIILIIDCVAELFDFKISSGVIEGILTTVCSVLVLLGIVTKKNVGDSCEISQDDLLQELKQINAEVDHKED